jgi:hypothetical protein
LTYTPNIAQKYNEQYGGKDSDKSHTLEPEFVVVIIDTLLSFVAFELVLYVMDD